MTKSSWRCDKKAWLALSVVAALAVAMGGTSPAFAQDPAQAQYDEAMAQYEWGDYDKAMTTFEDFLIQYPASDLADDAQYMLGQCYVQLERYDDAIFAFYTAAYKYPQSDRADDALIALAGHLYRQDYMPRALDAYEQLVKEYPQSEHAAYAQTCIGWLYGGMGDTEKAKAELEKVATNYPDSPYAEVAKESLKKLISETVPTEKFNKCEGDEPYLYVEDRIMGKGKTLEIPIMMCNAKELANMDLDWSFDASVLKLMDVTKGSLNKKALFDWNEVSPGQLKIAFASSKGDSAKKSSIAVMKFEVIGNTGATSTITGTVTTASKTEGTEISVSVNPGEFTVGTSQIKGDCDGDGELTGRDALAALQMSVGKRAIDMCYDYNKDGRVDSADAREMLKAIVGKK